MKRMILIIIFIVAISGVHALGVAPARSTFEFNGKTEGRFRVIVDEVPTKVLLTTEGELGEFIELEKDVFVATEQETWINFRMDYPEDMNPGEREGGILIMQVPKNTKENVVVATTAIVHQVKVNVPYPGKYMTGKLFITNNEVNEEILFTIALSNWGKEKIENAEAKIVIKGPTNEVVETIHTGSTSLEPDKETKLLGVWTTEYSGTYYAEVTVNYDGKSFDLSQKFNVGNQEVEIEKLEVGSFKIGQIAKFDIYLANEWNQPISINGRVQILKDNEMIASINTIPIDLDPKSTGIMNAYWNTEGIQPGNYDILVKAIYNNKVTEKTFSSLVSMDDITFQETISGRATAQDSRTTILIAGVIILIMINVMLFFYVKKKLRNK